MAATQQKPVVKRSPAVTVLEVGTALYYHRDTADRAYVGRRVHLRTRHALQLDELQKQRQALDEFLVRAPALHELVEALVEGEGLFDRGVVVVEPCRLQAPL